MNEANDSTSAGRPIWSAALSRRFFSFVSASSLVPSRRSARKSQKQNGGKAPHSKRVGIDGSVHRSGVQIGAAVESRFASALAAGPLLLIRNVWPHMMDASSRKPWVRAAILAGVVYVVVGYGSAALDPSVPDRARFVWRLAAWAVSAAVFAAHIGYEHFRLASCTSAAHSRGRRARGLPARSRGDDSCHYGGFTRPVLAVPSRARALADHHRPAGVSCCARGGRSVSPPFAEGLAEWHLRVWPSNGMHSTADTATYFWHGHRRRDKILPVCVIETIVVSFGMGLVVQHLCLLE